MYKTLTIVPLETLSRDLHGHPVALDVRRWTVWAGDPDLQLAVADYLDDHERTLTFKRCGVVMWGLEIVAAWCWMRYTDEDATYGQHTDHLPTRIAKA